MEAIKNGIRKIMIKISRIIMISEKSAPFLFFNTAAIPKTKPQTAYEYIITAAEKNYNEKFGKKTEYLF